MAPLDPSVRMRPFPFPFRAALAICSDIDSCDRPTFLAVHRLLNDSRQGLGLPVADSFFPLGSEPEQLAFFMPDGRTPGPDAELITDAVRIGLIDSIHSWGDFNAHPPEPAMLRAMAERLTARFQDHDLKVRLWINHGSPDNWQNIRARTRAGYRGDDPQSPFYTADLFEPMGIKYYWWSELVPWPLSCQSGRKNIGSRLRVGVNFVKNTIKSLTGHPERVRPSEHIMELCQTAVLRDGQNLIAFNRFNRHPRGIWAQPTRHTFRYSLCEEVISELVAQEGYLILYTHLGQPRGAGSDLFPAPDLAALQNLAEHYRAGMIWVTASSSLLSYWLVHNALEWEVFREGEKIIIDLGKLHDPTTGSRTPLESELAGLCFYSPEPDGTVIRLSGRVLSTALYPPDHTGSGSVGFAPAAPPDISLLDRVRNE